LTHFAGPEDEAVLTEMRRLLSKVEEMKGQRAKLEKQFRDEIQKDDITTVLMAADILLYRASVVPVGDDQVQHLELARDIARRFNKRYGRVFPEPKPKLSKTPRIMGLDGAAKMAKSKGNTIAISEPSGAVWKKLRGAFTDPQRLRRGDPGRQRRRVAGGACQHDHAAVFGVAVAARTGGSRVGETGGDGRVLRPER